MIKNKEIDTLLGEMRIFAKEQQIPISTSESIETIAGILERYKPKRCLEIGTCIGYGTIEIARRIAERNGEIRSYEISIPTFALAQSYTKQSGLSNINLLFENVLDTLDFQLSTFDFIYIDGQKSRYLDFLFAIKDLCSPDAVILFDDVLAFPEKTRELWDWITQNDIAHELVKHEDGDGMLILRKKNIDFRM